jgi:hypothetical protein
MAIQQHSMPSKRQPAGTVGPGMLESQQEKGKSSGASDDITAITVDVFIGFLRCELTVTYLPDRSDCSQLSDTRMAVVRAHHVHVAVLGVSRVDMRTLEDTVMRGDVPRGFRASTAREAVL